MEKVLLNTSVVNPDLEQVTLYGAEAVDVKILEYLFMAPPPKTGEYVMLNAPAISPNSIIQDGLGITVGEPVLLDV